MSRHLYFIKDVCYNDTMSAKDRRKKILIKLINSQMPISASSLADEFKVSRQIIVGDIALLRAGGHDITATPRGYVLEGEETSHPFVGIIACKHTLDELRDELYTIVDYGGTVMDVTIEHSIYGQLLGQLNISSRYEADLFVESVSGESDKPLSVLSGGIHLHKVGCKSEEIFEMIKSKLEEKGFIL